MIGLRSIFGTLACGLVATALSGCIQLEPPPARISFASVAPKTNPASGEPIEGRFALQATAENMKARFLVFAYIRCNVGYENQSDIHQVIGTSAHKYLAPMFTELTLLAPEQTLPANGAPGTSGKILKINITQAEIIYKNSKPTLGPEPHGNISMNATLTYQDNGENIFSEIISYNEQDIESLNIPEAEKLISSADKLCAAFGQAFSEGFAYGLEKILERARETVDLKRSSITSVRL